MMIKKALLLLFLCSSISISSQEWNQKTKQTKITFTIKNFGLNVDGDFSKIKINTNFNSKNLFESYINSEIVVKTISTGIESRDEHILDEDYFDEMINPRLAALAEIAWCSKAKRSWSQFRSSLLNNMEHLVKMGWKFHTF